MQKHKFYKFFIISDNFGQFWMILDDFGDTRHTKCHETAINCIELTLLKMMFLTTVRYTV